MEPTHDFDVERLEGVAGGLDEVDTGVDSVVNNVHAVDLVFGVEVGIVSLLDVFDNWAPRVIVVYKVAETGGVDDGKTQSNAVLFDISADGLDGDGLGNDVEARSGAFLGGV